MTLADEDQRTFSQSRSANPVPRPFVERERGLPQRSQVAYFSGYHYTPPDFGEGRVGFSPWYGIAGRSPTRPRFARPPSPKTGRDNYLAPSAMIALVSARIAGGVA
jgi:hypothetical protein